MKTINQNEMKEINGGSADWTGVLLNSFIKYIKLFFELGQSLGSASRRNNEGNYCSV